MKVDLRTLHSELQPLSKLAEANLPDVVSSFARIWLDLRGQRSAPEKSDIQPSRIRPRLLPNIMLWDVLDGDFRVRLAGTAYRDRAVQELSGQLLSEVYGDNMEMRHEFESVAYREHYSFIEQHVCWRGGKWGLRSRLLLPLSMENGAARHLVGFIGPGFRYELAPDGSVRRTTLPGDMLHQDAV